MDLWIRSQDGKKINKTESIGIMQNCFDKGYDIVNDFGIVGTYKTEKRAMQILDEIQNILQPRIICHQPKVDMNDMLNSLTNGIVVQSSEKIEMELKQSGQVVYQMPSN